MRTVLDKPGSLKLVLQLGLKYVSGGVMAKCFGTVLG